MTIRKLLCIVVAAALLLGVFAVVPVSASAEAIEYTTPSGAVYSLNNETGEMVLISGTFRSDSGGWGNLNKWAVKSITALDGVKFGGWTQALFNGFQVCKSMDFSRVDTSGVSTLNNFFLDCGQLASLDVSGWDTSRVSDMYQMFSGCSSLRELDLSSFDTSKVTLFVDLFEGCNPRTLTLSEKFTIGVQGKMVLSNGENRRNGWRIKGEPTAARVSGNDYMAVIAPPTETTTYKWIGYCDVDWLNWDGSQLVRSEEYKLETEIHPTYKGITPTKPDDARYTYTFSGWTDGENTYDLNYELPPVTGDITYTAVFTPVRKKFFAGHSLSLNGDIAVNFYIDVTVAGLTVDEVKQGTKTVSIDFEWPEDSTSFTVKSTDYDTALGLFKTTCNVAAAEMASTIHATAYINGNEYTDEYDDYSVRDYCEYIISMPENTVSKQAELVILAKEMLNYGAKAQLVFNVQTDNLANKNVDGYVMNEVTPEMVNNAISSANGGGCMSDMTANTSAFGLNYYGSSTVYLTETSLRHYYTITDQAAYDRVKNETNYRCDETKLPYVYFEQCNLPAAELDNLQTFTIGGQSYRYSVLDYARTLMTHSKTSVNEKNLGKATYLYNQAANAYFD